MAKLVDLARIVRSKNAGALLFTIDLIFEDIAAYVRVRDSAAFAPRNIGPLFGVTDNQVRIFHCEDALALKITVPRRTRSGDPGDADVYGAQQYAPLLSVDIPD